MVRYDSSLFYQAFKSMTKSPPNYCMLCYREADINRLVKPVAFTKFVEAVDLKAALDENLVCYMCERQAATAFKFYVNTKFALQIKNMVNMVMENSTDTSDAHIKSKFGYIIAMAKKQKLGDLEDIDISLKRIRQNTLLMQTEVLVLDVAPQVRQAPSPATDNAPCGKGGDKIQEVVILDEDDDVPLSSLRKVIHKGEIASPPKVTPQTQTAITAPTKAAHPIADASSPIRTRRRRRNAAAQPNNEASMTKNDTEKKISLLSAALSRPQKQIPIDTLNQMAFANNIRPISDELPSKTNYILHPIILDSNGTMTVPSLRATLQNGSFPMLTPTIVPDTSDPTKGLPVSLKVNERVEAKIIFDEDDNDGDVGKDGSEKVPAKRPVVNDARIDWEDKIPMDVITYLDATDPNAEKLLNPKLISSPPKKQDPTPPVIESDVGPQISQVRSLQSFNRRALKRPPDPNVIDLS